MFGCFYTAGPGPTDVYALSVWLHAKWHNVDSTCSCATLVCLGVFFTRADYTHFPCCSSRWCIIHLIRLILEPCSTYLITDLRQVWFRFASLVGERSWNGKPLSWVCLADAVAVEGTVCWRQQRTNINTQSRCEGFTARVCLSLRPVARRARYNFLKKRKKVDSD